MVYGAQGSVSGFGRGEKVIEMQDIVNELDGMQAVTTSRYKNTKTLLELYKKVRFRVEENLEDIDEELYIEDRKHLTSLVHELVDFDASAEKKRIQEQLLSNSLNLCLLEIMEDVLLIVKKYPDDGELYYQLLRYRYFDPFKNTNESVMEILDIPYSTYYRKQKRAIQLYAAMLWGMTCRKKNAVVCEMKMGHF